jgi:SWI/SNF-related matrix-associated actin-dependent regulator 1 of chromatin subfamily A
VKGSNDVHFAAEIRKWRDKRKHIAPDDDAEYSSRRCPMQVVIVTYSLLQTRYQIPKALMDCDFECIIVDESHNLKQISSQRCQLAMPLLHRTRRLVLLSGTPALNRPVELWPQLHALDARGAMFGGGMRYSDYTKRFCNARRTRFGYDVSGSSNAHELHMCLRTVMIRRLKSEVLHDLPSKQRSIVPVIILDKERERESRETIDQLKMARQAVSQITDLDADDVANSAQWEARKLLMQGTCLFVT